MAYIDREKALLELRKFSFDTSNQYGVGYSDCLTAVEDVLNDLPTADAEEVRHGEWEQNPYCKRIYFCSECGRHIEDGSLNPYEHFPYCHCGAKMGGKNENL